MDRRAEPALRLPALTGIRGLAAWWVVLYHAKAFAPAWLPAWADTVLARGYWAVDLFFVLSGFVLYLSYAPRLAPTAQSYADFLVRRLARIYPLHFVTLSALVLYALLVRARTGSLTSAYDVEALLLQYTLTQNWGLDVGLTWNVPAWSISTELFAYLLFPWFVLLCRPGRWSVAGLLAGVAAVIAGLVAAYALMGVPVLTLDIPQTGLIRCVAQFGIGVLLACLFQHLRAAAWAGPALLGAAVLGATAAVAWRVSDIVAVPAIGACVVLGLALLPRGNPFEARALVYLGEVSYATYLSHYGLLILWKLVFLESAGAAMAPGPALVYLGAVALASVVLYHGVERPAQRWMLARWGLMRRRSVAATVP